VTKFKTLISIVGPTAVGKTAMGVLIAKHFNTEIISADSRQIYQELAIGTAKPTITEMQGIKHHFIDSLSLTTHFSAGDFEKQGLILLEQLFQIHDVVVMVGGSGLFVKAITEGFDDMPKVDEHLRESLNTQLATNGLAPLLNQLQHLDPVYFNLVDKHNAQRIIRALEICLTSGKPYSTFRKSKAIVRNFNTISIGLEMPRDQLYDKINHRMDLMLEAGLLKEASAVITHRNEYALQTVGYTEVFGFLDKNYDYTQMVELLKRNSRRYAKRQLTWFKKDPQTKWFSPSAFDKIIIYIDSILK
jgi:tRNA dimethylallyltransferase